MKYYLAVPFILLSMSAHAHEWNCGNKDFEIACNNGKCEINTGFTPMGITFDSTGKMSVCAYSGCWEGKGKVASGKDFFAVTGHRLKFSTASSSYANVAIVVDVHDNIGVIKVESFAQPIVCTK